MFTLIVVPFCPWFIVHCGPIKITSSYLLGAIKKCMLNGIRTSCKPVGKRLNDLFGLVLLARRPTTGCNSQMNDY